MNYDSVVKAGAIHQKRLEQHKDVYSKSQILSSMQRKYYRFDETGGCLFKTAIEFIRLSARACNRILKVARTNANLSESENISAEHISGANKHHNPDREY